MTAAKFGRAPGSIDEVKRGRRQRVEGKRTIIEEQGGRTIVQEKGAPPTIRHDESERLRRTSRDVRTERRPDGGNLTIAIRPGGIEVFSEFDSSGRLQRRYRRGRDGRETNLIDNRRFRGRGPVIVDLRPPVLRMPRERYIVDYERASDADIYDLLMDGPIERLDRGYSLEEIRYNTYLRDRMRRIDLDTVNFEFGAWQVPYDQYNRLERIANAINRVLDRRPDEIFLIEGHTDAVGSDIDNLTLSDRRAEEVAIILTETFSVPPENLVTQGYGEEFLKIPTLRAERANRRVAVRRITPLLARGSMSCSRPLQGGRLMSSRTELHRPAPKRRCEKLAEYSKPFRMRCDGVAPRPTRSARRPTDLGTGVGSRATIERMKPRESAADSAITTAGNSAQGGPPWHNR